MKNWSCYFIASLDSNSTYIGSTNNPERRIATHNASRGAKYTRGETWIPIIIISGFNKRSCLSFEAGWKKLSKRRNNQKLTGINQLTGNQYRYTRDTKWNRILDLLYFTHHFTYIAPKFILNHHNRHEVNPPEKLIMLIFLEDAISLLPWPFFISFSLIQQ